MVCLAVNYGTVTLYMSASVNSLLGYCVLDAVFFRIYREVAIPDNMYRFMGGECISEPKYEL